MATRQHHTDRVIRTPVHTIVCGMLVLIGFAFSLTGVGLVIGLPMMWIGHSNLGTPHEPGIGQGQCPRCNMASS